MFQQRRESNGYPKRLYGAGGRSAGEKEWKTKDDSSQTAPASSSSSCDRTANKSAPNKGATGFDLPQWEHPGFQESPSAKHSRPPVPPQQSRQTAAHPTAAVCRSTTNNLPGNEILENMIVTCSGSISSFDDITVGSEYGDATPRVQHDTGQRTSTNIGLLSPPRHEEEDDDAMTAEMAQEEEIFKLAVERSLQDTGSACSSRHSYARASPRRTCSSSILRPPPPYRISPRRTSSSNSRIQTDANTGKQFIWKKGPNNRYKKVTVHSLDDGSVRSAASNQSCNRSTPLSTEESLERMEQKMLEEALNRSLAEVSLEGTSAASEASGVPGARTSPAGPRGGRSPSTKFIWKKGPNNRYFKCPIGLDQVNEGEVYGDEQASKGSRLEQMEEEMFREAMERSIRDL